MIDNIYDLEKYLSKCPVCNQPITLKKNNYEIIHNNGISINNNEIKIGFMEMMIDEYLLKDNFTINKIGHEYRSGFCKSRFRIIENRSYKRNIYCSNCDYFITFNVRIADSILTIDILNEQFEYNSFLIKNDYKKNKTIIHKLKIGLGFFKDPEKYEMILLCKDLSNLELIHKRVNMITYFM